MGDGVFLQPERVVVVFSSLAWLNYSQLLEIVWRWFPGCFPKFLQEIVAIVNSHQSKLSRLIQSWRVWFCITAWSNTSEMKGQLTSQTKEILRETILVGSNITTLLIPSGKACRGMPNSERAFMNQHWWAPGLLRQGQQAGKLTKHKLQAKISKHESIFSLEMWLASRHTQVYWEHKRRWFVFKNGNSNGRLRIKAGPSTTWRFTH